MALRAEPLSENIEAVIRKAGDDWAKYWNAKDLDHLVSIYAPDAVYLPPHHGAVHGRDAIREYLKGPLAHGVTELSFEVTYIKHDGNLAYDVGRYAMSVPQQGTRKQDRGKYLTVWRRQTDGRWHITADAWSSDLPAGN